METPTQPRLGALLKILSVIVMAISFTLAALLSRRALARIDREPDLAIFALVFAATLFVTGARLGWGLVRPRRYKPVPRTVFSPPTRRERSRARFLALVLSLMIAALGIAIWNNPADLGGLAVGGAFILLGIAGVIGVMRARRTAEFEADGSRIIAHERWVHYVYWVAAGQTGIFSVGYGWVGLMFAPVAIGFLIAAIHGSLRERRYGRSVLVLADPPPRRTAPLRGTIECSRAVLVQAVTPFRIKLELFERTIHRGFISTDDQNMQDPVLTWSAAEEEIPASRVQLTPAGVAIPVDITIPPELPPASREGSTAYSWQLTVSRSLPGVDFGATFQLFVQ